MAQQGAGRTVETEADMVYLVISVIDRDGTVTATIKLEPDTAATVLADLTNDPRAGPGVLLNKDDANIRESERKLQPEEGPYKYLLKLGRSAHEEPPGTDVSAFTKAVHDELDPIRKALERTSRSTVQASKISDDDLAALRDSVGAKVKYLSSDDDPEALTKLLIASPTNTDKVWGKEPEPDQRDMYHAVLRDNISASSRLFSWVDAKGLEVKLQVRGQYFKVVCKNDELLIVRNYGVEPPTGAVMGFEVKKALTKERLRQAEAEYYIFAHRSMFAYAQFYTDLTTGAVVFYSDKHADGQLTVNVHTLVGMSAVWDFAKAMLSAMPKDIGQACAHDDDFSPDELRSPKRIKLTGALFQPVSRIEAIRILCDIQSYDIACLEDLDDPNLYAQHNDLLQPFNS